MKHFKTPGAMGSVPERSKESLEYAMRQFSRDVSGQFAVRRRRFFILKLKDLPREVAERALRQIPQGSGGEAAGLRLGERGVRAHDSVPGAERVPEAFQLILDGRQM